MRTQDLDSNFDGIAAPARIATVNPPGVAGMQACIDDARAAALDNDPGPAEPRAYKPLLGRLDAAQGKLPPLYRDTMAKPFIATLRQIGEQGFNQILLRDPQRERAGGLMMDIAQAILQQGEGFAEGPTDAFEEVVSDLYDGFLSAEDRQGVNPPDRGAIPPLVKWGNPDFGPYTWPIDATSAFGCKAAVVNMPPANTRRGLVAWAALGHETAGHDIIHADTGLERELSEALQQKLAPLGHGLDQYWSTRIDETASDVMGILNVGPAAGIGLIPYFRALNAAFTRTARLRNEGPDGDPHPADVLRGYLAAETVSLLKFTGRRAWSKLIAEETTKDLTTIVLAGEPVSKDLARKSAKVVAETLVGHRAKALENHALGEIQNWRDSDERKVGLVRTALRTDGELPKSSSPTPIYAAHAVAAAVTEAFANGNILPQLFKRMLAMLSAMHDQNPSWGPLFVAHPGDLVRDMVYCRQIQPKPETKAHPVRLASRKLRQRKKSVSPVRRTSLRHRG
jgi:hypothetical protein